MKFTPITFLLVLFLGFYGIVTAYLLSLGYLNFEPLFISSNISSVFVSKNNIVKNFFLTYPLLAQIVAYPFAIINILLAPYFSSVFFVSLFNAWLVNKTYKQRGFTFTILLGLFLFCSPINLYLASSGTSTYLNFILFYICFYYLFIYVKNYTTFHLTIFSLWLSVFAILDYKVLYLLILAVPMAFLFTANSTIGVKSNVLLRLAKIAQYKSLRRKFFGRFGAMVMVMSFFPVLIFGIYICINYLFGQEFFFFKHNGTSQWNIHHILNLVDLNYQKGTNINFTRALDYLAINNYTYLTLIVALMPLFILEYIYRGRNNIKQILFISPIILLAILFMNSKVDILSLNLFLIFQAIALASISTTLNKSKSIKKLGLFGTVLVLAFFGEFYYLKNTISPSEHIFYNSVTKNEHSLILNYMEDGANAVKDKIPSDTKIMCDNSIFYPLIELNEHHNLFMNNLSNEFQLSINNPADYAKYVIVTTTASPFYEKDVVRISIEENEKLRQFETPVSILFENKHFKILRINN